MTVYYNTRTRLREHPQVTKSRMNIGWND